jgi:hypothetical protein
VVHPAHGTAPTATATYGALFGDAVTAVTEAREHAVGPFETATSAADTTADYERFLAVSGRHLQLLLAPTPAVSTRDRALHLDRHGGNGWARAGDALGLAHDLLATHVGPRGELRSPEAVILTATELQRAAVDRVVQMVRHPLTDAKPLLRQARDSQPATEPPLDPADAKRLSTTASRAVHLLAQPAPVVADDGLLERLDRLPPVQTKLDDNSSTVVLQSMSTLHTLRQITLRQSRGEESANAHSLQELCRLAVATCRSAERTLPYASTPLDRVARAASIDQLRQAETHWAQLGGRLYPRIQGLSKAPVTYHDAVTTITEEATTSEVATRAVLSCLPRLALQSANTVAQLHNHGELVTCGRAPGELTTRWRALSPAEARDLAQGFVVAGRATHRASNAVRRQLDPTARQAPAKVASPQRSRGLGVER